VEWYDDILEENNMLIPEWDRKSTDDTSQNVEQLGSTVEFVVFVDESKEALIDGLSNHFPSWHELGV